MYQYSANTNFHKDYNIRSLLLQILSGIIGNLWQNSAFRPQGEETIRYAYAEPFPGTIIGCRVVVRERPLQIQRQLAGQAVNTWMLSSNWSRTNDNENSITLLGLEKADCRGNPASTHGFASLASKKYERRGGPRGKGR